MGRPISPAPKVGTGWPCLFVCVLSTGGTGTVNGHLRHAPLPSGARLAAVKRVVQIRTPVCGAHGNAASLSVSGARLAYWCRRTTASAAAIFMTASSASDNLGARTWIGNRSRLRFGALSRWALGREQRGTHKRAPRETSTCAKTDDPRSAQSFSFARMAF